MVFVAQGWPLLLLSSNASDLKAPTAKFSHEFQQDLATQKFSTMNELHYTVQGKVSDVTRIILTPHLKGQCSD